MLKVAFLYKRTVFFDKLAFFFDEQPLLSKKPFIYKSCQLV